MTLRFVLNATAALALATSVQTAHAANEGLACASPAVVKDRLDSAFGETLHSVGMTKSQFRIEVFASEVSGTWTITARKGKGPSCILASGEGFDRLARQVAVLGD